MKNVMKKSLIMAFAVMMTFVFSFSTSFAGTTPKPELNYVAIGSSTANGYGLDGYKHENSGIRYTNTGEPQEVKASYPRKFEALLGGKYEVNFTNLCPEGLRTNELRALLNYSVERSDDYYHKNSGDVFLASHTDIYFHSAFNKTTTKEVSDYFKESIREADIITLDACENNFGSYLAQRIQNIATNNNSLNQTIEDIDEIPDNVKILVAKAKEESLELLATKAPLDEQMNGLLDQIIDALVYCAATCCVNFTVDVQEIYKLKPDVDLIVFGITNPLKNVWIQFNGEDINFGKIAQVYVDAVNMYIKALDPNSNRYKFADCTECEIVYDALLEKEEFSLEQHKTIIPTTAIAMVTGCESGSMIDETFTNYVIRSEGIGSKTSPISIDKLVNALGALSNPNPESLMNDASDIAVLLNYLQARFLANEGIGAHPTVKGHEQKFEALWTAYNDDTPSREVVFNEIKAELEKQLKAKIDELNLENLTLGDIDKNIASLEVYQENEADVKSVVDLVCEKVNEFREYAIEGTELDKALDLFTPDYVKTLTVKDVNGIAETLAAAIKADAEDAAEYAEGTLCLGGDLTALISEAEALPEKVLVWTKDKFENTLNTAWAAIEAIGDVAFEDTKDVANYVLDNSKKFADYLLTNGEVGQKIESFEVDPAKVFEIAKWFGNLSNHCKDEEYEKTFDMVYDEILKGYEYIKENKGEEIEAKVDEVKTEATSIYEAVYEQAMEDVKDLVDSIWDIATTKDEITPSQIEAVINAISTIDVTETLNVLYENCPEEIKNCKLIEMYKDTLNTVWEEGQKVYNAFDNDIQNVYEGVSEEFANGVNAGKAAAIAVYKLVEASYADVAEKETLNEAAIVALEKANDELAKLGGGYTILHTIEKVDAKAPTSIEDGCKEHYVCTKCGELFWDVAGLKPADKNDVIIPFIHVTGINLNKTALTLTVGYYETLTATVSPASATNKNISWTSDKPSVAKVENGKVTAVGVGTATITVTTEDGNKTATCNVTVNSDYYPPYNPPYNPGNPTVTPVTPAEEKPPVEEEKKTDEEKTLVEKKAEAKAELNSAIADNGFKAKSAKQTKLNGKKALKISWTKVKGADGYEVFRSTKKNSGYGTKPYFSTKKTTYTNNKNLKAGKTYYYKVRAYKLVEGQKVYSDWSLKAWRKIK